MDTEPAIKNTVLIVDDAPENITVLGALLRTDYTVRIATNGEKALQIVHSDNPPDLILLDVVMPGMDGYEVCQVMKANPLTQNIPVIFITAKTSEADEVKGFELGAVDYITKPFSPVVIKARVRTHIELKRYRDLLMNTSYLDGLTGVPNRRRFDEYYSAMWNISIRQSFPLSLIMIDLDNFKQYNDNYGHLEGDACLIKIAQTLSLSLKRKSDLFARYGGEEFVCLLPDTDHDGAMKLAEEFRTSVLSLQVPHAYSAVEQYVTISQGVATITPMQDTSIKTLIMYADEELFRAKNSGRNKVCSIVDDENSKLI